MEKAPNNIDGEARLNLETKDNEFPEKPKDFINDYSSLLSGVERHFMNPQKTTLPNGLEMEYHTHGCSHATNKILLIMGLWTTKEAWLPVVQGILQRRPNEFQLVTFDNRGIGGSSAPSGRYTTSMMAQDSLLLMDKLGWDSAHLVGISMGGMIAMEVASCEPQRVKSLGLIVTSAGYPQIIMPGVNQLHGIFTMLRASVQKLPADIVKSRLKILYQEEFLNRIHEKSGMTNREILMKLYLERMPIRRGFTRHGALAQLAAVLSHKVGSKRLESIRDVGFPILIVGAKKDKLMNPHNTISLLQFLNSNHTKSVMYDDAGHGVVFQYMDQIVDHLLQTVESSFINAISNDRTQK